MQYEVGQYYRSHHDYIRHQRERHCGPRILTFFLYLTDVEEGGATRLNDLGIDVEPKVGRALLWPSVMNYDPMYVERKCFILLIMYEICLNNIFYYYNYTQ